MKKIAFLTLPLVLAAQFAAADVMPADEQLKSHLGADAASEIKFEAGRSTLTSAELTALNDLIAQHKQGTSKIDEVKVFVWPDKQYSITQGAAATGNDKKIADERIKAIKNYLQKDLKIRDVETFNMARQPRAFQDLMLASGSTVRGLVTNAPTAAATPAASGATTTTTTTTSTTVNSQENPHVDTTTTGGPAEAAPAATSASAAPAVNPNATPSQKLEQFIEGNVSEALILVYKK